MVSIEKTLSEISGVVSDPFSTVVSIPFGARVEVHVDPPVTPPPLAGQMPSLVHPKTVALLGIHLPFFCMSGSFVLISPVVVNEMTFVYT
jgi:hypothetical protein